VEWFVHFRYPDHDEAQFVDSPLGSVPTRFEVARLGACCNINREQRRPEPDEEIVYINISALGDRTVALPTPIPGSDAPGRARRVLSDGDRSESESSAVSRSSSTAISLRSTALRRAG